jgi:hypothetical protein
MNKHEVFLIIQKIIHSYDDKIICIKSDQNAPAPEGLYASVRVDHNSERLAAPTVETVVDNEGLTHTYSKEIMFTVSINFYRTGALDACEYMLSMNDLQSVSELLTANGLGWGGTSNVRNLTALQYSEMEERAQIEVRLYANPTVTDKTGYIDIDKFTFTATNGDNNVL